MRFQPEHVYYGAFRGRVSSWLDFAHHSVTPSLKEPAQPVNPWLQIATLFGLFVGGGAIGLWLSGWAAPDSGLAAGISALLLPTAFAGGLLIWSGLDLFFAVVNLFRGRRRQPGAHRLEGSSWFVPLSVALSGAGGFLVALVPGGQGLINTVLAYSAAGWIYGVLAAKLAAAGYLPAPHSY